jgi:hypothetical protein
MHSYLHKNFILVKSGCYSSGGGEDGAWSVKLLAMALVAGGGPVWRGGTRREHDAWPVQGRRKGRDGGTDLVGRLAGLADSRNWARWPMDQ